eukprot:symbB.v1.2.034535.t2/scaffold4479.1/size39210/1
MIGLDFRHEKNIKEKNPRFVPPVSAQNVPVALRSGAARFRFWRDLKPPFQVVQVTRSSDALGKWRDVDAAETKPHPDGELFYVTYECALAHHVERAWGLKTEGGTFNNRVHGACTGGRHVTFCTYILHKPAGVVSQRNDLLGRETVYDVFDRLKTEGTAEFSSVTIWVRIPLDYPDKSRCIITSWGNPVVNWTPSDDKDPIVEPPSAVDPMLWMPIADELQQRPSIKQFAACRQETRIASRRVDEKRKRGIEVPEMTRILLSSNPSLPRLAAAEQRCVDEAGKAGSSSPTKRQLRKHCVFTASSGFVHYAG